MTDAGGERTSGRGGCGLGLAGRPAEVGALFDRHQSAPPYLSAATTGCATSRTTTTQPHRPVCGASTWTVVVAGPAPGSDTVFLYGVP